MKKTYEAFININANFNIYCIITIKSIYNGYKQTWTVVMLTKMKKYYKKVY